MTEKSSSGHPREDAFDVPPPPGPPPGNNGLAMHPNEQPIPDSHSELYDTPPPGPYPSAQQQAYQTQQTPHQPPPPDSDGAPKKASWGQRFSLLGTKAAAPFNMLANKLGSETFLPSTMDKEVEKAARILRAFCSTSHATSYYRLPHQTSFANQSCPIEDGIYTDDAAPETVQAPTTDANGKPTTVTAKPKKNRTLLSIPSEVINRAAGLAVFTTARMGFHVSGATGSGIIVARLPDGSWSPPSGIQVHSVGAGFMVGLDIYDCVVVINTREALEAFTKTRMSLGSDLAIVAGPWGAGGSVDFAAPTGGKGKKDANAGTSAAAATDTQPTETAKDEKARATTPPAVDEKSPAETDKGPTVNEPATETTPGTAGTDKAERPQAGKERKPSALKQAIKQPTYSYVKSRGFYAGVQVDGTIVTERKDANAAFYGEPVSVQGILRGDAPLVPGKENWVNIVKPLFDTIKGAEGWRGQQQGQGAWANQMSPDFSSTYGHGNAPQGYPTGFDPVFDNPPPKPPRPTSGVAGATEGVAAMNLGSSSGAGGSFAFPPPPPPAAAATGEPTAAQAKAAEAAAEAEMNREREDREQRTQSMATAPPGYSELTGPGEASRGNASEDAAGEQVPPPAYVDDGTPKPGTGDTKSHPSS